MYVSVFFMTGFFTVEAVRPRPPLLAQWDLNAAAKLSF
jgi:hypothetical protein